MACYVKVGDKLDTEEFVEIPTENDGILLLTSVSAQFPGAVGLRYKAESGAFRGCRVEGNNIDPPLDGWGDTEYIVIKKATKREAEENAVGPIGKLNKIEGGALLELMVAGLSDSTTAEEMRNYFEKFGAVDSCDIKYDDNRKSRGYGFIRLKKAETMDEILVETNHVLDKRQLDIRPSKRSSQGQLGEEGGDSFVTKLFIGRLPPGTTTTDLQQYFSKYGVLKDVYIPTPFKGYGFVSFGSQTVAMKVVSETHLFKGHFLNVSTPSESKRDVFGKLNPGFTAKSGGGFGNTKGSMQSTVPQMGNIAGGMQSNIPQTGNMTGSMQSNIPQMGNMAGSMQSNIPFMGNMKGGIQSNVPLMGNMQPNTPGAANKTSLLGGTQNNGSNLGPPLGYGYQGNGNYFWPVTNW